MHHRRRLASSVSSGGASTPRRVSVGASIVLMGLLAACDDRSAPTQPSPKVASVPTPTPAPSGAAALVSLSVDGPSPVQPGESAQYTAIASYADGSTRAVTTEARWSSSDESVLSVTATGAMTARANGEAEVQASFGTRSDRRHVIVVPAGRYVVRAFVSEDQVTAMIYNARIEVVAGPAAGLAATTDWDGHANLYGVPADAQLRITKMDTSRSLSPCTSTTTGPLCASNSFP